MCYSLQRLGYLEAVQYYEARLHLISETSVTKVHNIQFLLCCKPKSCCLKKGKDGEAWKQEQVQVFIGIWLDRLCFECGLTPDIQIKYTSLLKNLVINTIVNLNLQFFQLICNLRDFHPLYFGPLTNTLWIYYPLWSQISSDIIRNY